MVVYVMRAAGTWGECAHATMWSRHVEVHFPSRAEVMSCHMDPAASTSVRSAVPPNGAKTSSRSRFSGAAAPTALISDEWMATLVQYVAVLKKVMFDDAREEMSEAVKQHVPLELKSQIRMHSESVNGVGILYGGHVSEPVAAHETLTRHRSMRRVQRDGTNEEHAPFLNSVYMHDQDCDGDQKIILDEQTNGGKLGALVANSVFQQARVLLNKERAERLALEELYCRKQLNVVDELEEEARFEILYSEGRCRNRMESDEVGQFLQRKRQSLDSARAATILRAADALKGEKDSLRDETLRHAIAIRQEVATERATHLEVLETMIRELPLQPNASNIDAEVARLVLRARREDPPNYFPGFE